MQSIRVGFGYDVHKLVEGRPLVLGGVTIPHVTGLAGHSDADVLLHAVCDAMLGAAALGDIGKHFPETDEAFRDVDSRLLLRKCNELLTGEGYMIGNIDTTIVAQKPKLAPYITEMRSNIAKDLGLDPGAVSVKATTSERLGFEGKEEGISATAVIMIYKP